MAFLVLENLDKRFGDHPVIRGVSLAVERGEILALLGPSGSGKTTLLRLLAGFETPDAGAVRVAGEEITQLPPARRRFGMVFQHYALFPHLSVGDNVAFGLDSSKVDAGRRRRRVAEVLALVDLAGFEERRVGEISGGQQQRVAVARALAPEPRVLLLDEPLSNLDPALRERTRRELRRTIREVGITTVLVTHEQDEAFDLGDRVALLHDGILQQVGTAEELYERPATRFTATFMGRANALRGIFEPRTNGGAVRLDGFADRGVVWEGTPAGDGLAAGVPAEIVVRPEALAFAAAGEPGAVAGRVVESRYAGPVAYHLVRLEGGADVEVLAPWDSARPGAEVAVAPRGQGPAPRIFAAEVPS